MSKKHVLIITSQGEQTVGWQERERFVAEFCRAVQQRLDNVLVRFTTYEDLVVQIVAGKVAITDTRHGNDIAKNDFVQFKNWVFEPELSSVVAMHLQANKVAFFNSEVLVRTALGKLSQMVQLAQAGIAVPDTLYAKPHHMQKLLHDLPTGFSLPCILKSSRGSRGDDNYLIKNPTDATEVLANTKTDYIVQNFIPNNGDYRLLFVGVDESPMVFLRKGEGDTHLNNTSKGGSGSMVRPDSLPEGVLAMAGRAAEVLQREISGVDVIINKQTNQAYILEVNTTPALATGYASDKKINKFASFLERALAAQEDEE